MTHMLMCPMVLMIGHAARSDATVSNDNSLVIVSSSPALTDIRRSQVYLIFQIHTTSGTISFKSPEARKLI